MKNRHNTFLLILFIVLLAPVASQAIIAPHNTSSGYRCSVCHNTHSTLGTTGFNNLCVQCHNGSDVKAYKRFYVTDAANPYGSITTVRLIKYQTSHNWAGSDVNPAAGAKAPTIAAMNATATITGALLCVRCHSVHGERESATNSAPFLRTLNDNDQMCRDCHTVRDTNTHMTGSHPVNVNYTTSTSKVKLFPEKFQQTPINANPANPTSAMKLINGAIQCSTCHGVHYTDSRSGTLDHFSSASFNRLSTSKGFLLRSDARGKTATDINICTNCHAGKGAHNGSGQNIQCNDCHSGHVEYDPQAVTAEEKKPNLFVIRRLMNVSTAAGRNSKVRTFYRYTGSQKEFWRANGALGVCQACHNDKASFQSGHYNVPGNKSSGIRDERKICADCHDHKGAFGCSACHGFPPKKNQKGTDGFAVYSTPTNQGSRVLYSTLVDESKTPHSSHADGTLYKFACIQCHKGNTTHNTGNYQQVFLDKTNIIAGGGATYVAGSTRSCANMYCHSNAQGTVYKTVYWKDTKDTIVKGSSRCQQCHADKITTSALSGVHERHAASTGINYSCQNCHAKTLRAYAFANNTGLVYPSTSHVNGIKDVSYSFGDSANSGLLTKVADSILPYNNAQTCNTIYCHSNGAGQSSKVVPNWNNAATGQCGSCHGVLGPVGTNTYGVIASNAHFTHISSSYGPRLINSGAPIACQNCHYSYDDEKTHVNGNKVANQSAGSTCYKCHGGLQQGPIPTWSDTNRVACTRCHPIWGGYSAARIGTVLAPKQINYSTSGHGKKATPYNKMACTECHDQNSAHISKPPLLGDNKRLIAVNYTGARIGGASANAICGKCHWAGQSAQNKVRFTHVTSVSEAQNGKPTMACSRCHNVHGTSNFGMLNNSIVFNPNSSAYPIVYQSPYSSIGLIRVAKPGPYSFIQTVAPYRGICQVCHTKTMHFKRGRSEATNGPANGINANTGGSIVSHISMNQSTNCLSCHQHTPPPTSPGKYAFYPFGKCDACHGYPPVPKSFVIAQNNYSSGKFEDYSGGGGAHVVAGHVPASANPSQSWALCSSCHNENDHLSVPTYPQVKVSINDGLRFNSTIQPKYSSNRLDGGTHITGTCYNVSCHFQRTPKWGKP